MGVKLLQHGHYFVDAGLFLVELSGIFNWNVKQLFIYLTAEYETENNVGFAVL